MSVSIPAETAPLKTFEGRWRAQGDVYTDTPPVHWLSEENYEWLPGQHFITYRWDAVVGGKPFKGLAVFGHEEGEGYFAQFFDDSGHAPYYRVEVDGATWKLEGAQQRAVYEFTRNGETMKIHWDVRKDEEDDWQALCDLTAHRI